MKIIGGDLRGRRLRTPPGLHTRPTAARVREAWFSAIAADLAGARVLDLFAGSGALGIEALSRGAGFTKFVESHSRARRALEANIQDLDLRARCEIDGRDVFRVLATMGAATGFDLALADPPYGKGSAARLLEVWLERPFARMLCVEHRRSELEGADAAWSRVYGDTELSFFIAPGRSE